MTYLRPNLFNISGAFVAVAGFLLIYGLPTVIAWDGLNGGGKYFGWSIFHSTPSYVIILTLGSGGYVVGCLVRKIVFRIK